MCAARLLGLCARYGGRQAILQFVAIAVAAWLAAGLLSSGIGLLQYLGIASGLEPWVSQTSPERGFC